MTAPVSSALAAEREAAMLAGAADALHQLARQRREDVPVLRDLDAAERAD